MRTGTNKWQTMFAVAIGTFLSAMSSSIINVALPFIGNYFEVDMASLEWVVMAYLLVISSLLIAYGRLGDIWGYKSIYLTGFVIFTAASLLCAISETIHTLIAFRVLQGIGAGMIMAIGPAILTATFPPQERGKALGMIGMVVASALATGPFIGGIMVQFFDWQMVFYLNIPLGILGVVWGSYILPKSIQVNKQAFDYPGAIALFLTLFAILLSLSHGQQWGWSSSQTLSLLGFGLLMLGFFIWWELRHPQPLMDLNLFKIRLFSAASVSALINYMAMFSYIFLIPFYLKDVAGLDPSHIGMLMVVSPLMILLSSPISGTLSDKIGSRTLSSLGLALTCLRLFLLSGLGPAFSPVQLILPLLLFGLGSGLFQAPNSSAIMGSVPKQRLGIASSTIASMRNMGMVMGIAISGAVFNGRLPIYLTKYNQLGYQGQNLQATAFVNAMHDAFLVAALLAVFGVVTSYVRGSQQPLGQPQK